MKNSTQVPNILFDQYLPHLSPSELKILLIIIRQTNGWINKKTGRRKVRDRITMRQFIKKTGLSRKSASVAINKLQQRRLITVTDARGSSMSTRQRKGRLYLFYSVKSLNYERKYKMLAIGELINYVN